MQFADYEYINTKLKKQKNEIAANISSSSQKDVSYDLIKMISNALKTKIRIRFLLSSNVLLLLLLS